VKLLDDGQPSIRATRRATKVSSKLLEICIRGSHSYRITTRTVITVEEDDAPVEVEKVAGAVDASKQLLSVYKQSDTSAHFNHPRPRSRQTQEGSKGQGSAKYCGAKEGISAYARDGGSHKQWIR
jgi:hypothetical protein